MPFRKLSVSGMIEQEKERDPEFAAIWDASRTEYELLGELVRIRKESSLTQAQLSRLTGYKQQFISRIEKRESSPTLKTFCSILYSLGYELQIVKRGGPGSS